MPQPLLEGNVEYDERPDLRQQIVRLENDLANTRRELSKARGELAGAKEAAENIRSILHPLYRSLRLLFGDIEALVGDSSPNDPRKSAAWDLWKQKLPGWPAKFIDALLEHQELSVGQLVVAMQCSRKQTIYDVASKLGRLGLIQNIGGKYSLKEL
jgi:hypothetical protein